MNNNSSPNPNNLNPNLGNVPLDGFVSSSQNLPQNIQSNLSQNIAQNFTPNSQQPNFGNQNPNFNQNQNSTFKPNQQQFYPNQNPQTFPQNPVFGNNQSQPTFPNQATTQPISQPFPQIPKPSTQNQPIPSDFSVNGVDFSAIKVEKPKGESKPNLFSKLWSKVTFSGLKNKNLYKFLIVLTGILTIVGIFASISFLTNKTQELYNKVNASLEISPQIAQGSPSRFVLNIENQNSVPIDNINVNLDFDSDFQFIRTLNNLIPSNIGGNNYNLGRIQALETGNNKSIVAFEGVLSGKIDKELYFGGKISYTANQKNYEQPIAKVKTLITSPDIRLTLDSRSQDVQNGGETEFNIKIKNIKEKEISDLQLKLDYPGGNTFSYINSELTSSLATQNKTTPDNGDNVWYIPKLPGLSETTLVLRGKVNTKDKQKLSFGANLNLKTADGSYQNISKTFKDINITVEPILIKTYINANDSQKTFKPEERLNFVIEYVNQSQNTIKEAQILGSIDDPSNLLDLGTIEFSGGSRAFVTNSQIQWIGNNTPQLASISPNSRGKLEYSVQVKKDILRTNLKQSDYTVRPEVKIKASNLQEVATTGPLYKMSSNINFKQTVAKITPEVTTQSNRERYRITWGITTQQNQIDELVVRTRTSLPASSWQSKSVNPFDQVKNINYNSANGDMEWKVDKLPPYSGIGEYRAFEISFELEFEKQPTQGETKLVENIAISAKDNYTGQNFNLQSESANARE